VFDYSYGDDPEFTNDYVINFDAYEMPQHVDNLIISIPVTTCDSTLIPQLESIGDYSYSYEDLAYGKMALAVYPDLVVEGDFLTQNKYMSNYIEIPPNTSLIDFYISIKHAYHGPEDASHVLYYNEDKEQVFTDRIGNDSSEDRWHQWNPYTDLDINLLNLAWSFWGYDVSNEIKYIRFELYDYNNTYGLVGASRIAREYMYYLDGQSIEVNYIVEGEIDKTVYAVAGGFIVYREIPPTVSGKTFSHWMDANGEIFEGSITTDIITNNTTNIYAIYITTKTVVNPAVDDPTPTGGNFEILLTEVGFNDPAERVIIFALIIIMISIILLVKGVALFNILVVDGIIVAFFISLGLLPAFVSIIIIIILIFFGWRYVMTGGGGDE